MEKNKKNFKQTIYTIIVILVMIVLLYVLAKNTNNIDIGELPADEIINSEELQIYFFNVGQADCILVRNDGKNMLIDAGDNEDGPLLVEYIKRLGITRIDYLINKSKRVFYEDVISAIEQEGLDIDYQEKVNGGK